ncbi:DUF5007 domain-containing protein [uncultured Chitinophaga sp.]|uniref:DUF5007 domain-containing protein n=1 Tax=uncultured Chitinophaga sp. TaxID=339340 RepID=UPI0025D092FE|nr:DUF5007 domain-containing protein [uncultured Chitinophaga sp.]
MKKIIVSIAILGAVVAGCEKVTPGFLSSQMRYKDTAVYCKRGFTLAQSERVNADESTPPITFKLMNLTDDATGKPAPAEFFNDYDVVVFKEGMSFNPETDTTLAALNTKRETQKLKPMYFNEVSGQFTFNKASVNLPLGSYSFDMEVSNVAGKKTFEKFSKIKVVDPTTDDIFQVNATAAAVFSDATGASVGIRNPVLNITKLSGDGARLILKVSDKNGKAFNPKNGEVIRRGDRPVFENYARFNPVIFTDTAMICDFEVAPFPLASYIDNTGYNWGGLMYYRIPSQFVTVDGYPQGGYSLNPRWDFKVKLEGTYLLEIVCSDAVHK